MKNKKQFYDLYLTCDVLSLADVFERFRKTYLKCYKLDPSYYLISSALFWNAICKIIGVKN